MAEKFKEQAVIISQEEIAPAIYSLWIKTDKIAQYAKAGQFISIYCEDGSRLLPRPISICEIDKEDSALHISYCRRRNRRIFPEADRRLSLCDGTAWKRFPVKEQKSIPDRWRYRYSANAGTCKTVKL